MEDTILGSTGFDLDNSIQTLRKRLQETENGGLGNIAAWNDLAVKLFCRYNKAKDQNDLEEAIQFAEMAVNATPDESPERGGRLSNLALALRARYMSTRLLSDLEETIKVGRKAVESSVAGQPERAIYLSNLGVQLGNLYSRTGKLSDLDDSIEASREAVSETPLAHPNRPDRLQNLGNRLINRHTKTDGMGDLDEAIEVARESIHLTSPGRPERAPRLNTLANRLVVRYSKTAVVEDITDSVKFGRECIASAASSDPRLVKWLSDFDFALGTQYQQTNSPSNLNEAIPVAREVIRLTSPDDLAMWKHLARLRERLYEMYKHSKDLAHLEESIHLGMQILEYCPADPNIDLAATLDVIAVGLNKRYIRTKKESDLEECLEYGQAAAEMTPEGHPLRAGVWNNLSNYLLDQFQLGGSIQDLRQAVECGRQASTSVSGKDENLAGILACYVTKLDILSQKTDAETELNEAILVARESLAAANLGDSEQPTRLVILSRLLHSQYCAGGAKALLDEAVELIKEAIHLTPEDASSFAAWKDQLGVMLGDRYARTKAATDLDESIRIGRQVTESKSDEPAWLCHLSISLLDRARRDNEITDLDEAIRHVRRALTETPQNDSEEASRIDLLGVMLHEHYLRTNTAASLEESLLLGRQLIDLDTVSKADGFKWLHNLGIVFMSLHLRTGEMEPLEQAIQLLRRAVSETPKSFYGRGTGLSALGTALSHRFARKGQLTDLDEGIQLDRESVKATPQDHQSHPNYLANLAASLQYRYSITSQFEDLEESINTSRRAVAFQATSPDRSHGLVNLAQGLYHRYERSQSEGDLEEIMQRAREAISTTPPGHPIRGDCLHALVVALRARYERFKEEADLEEAFRLLTEEMSHEPEYSPRRASQLTNFGYLLYDQYNRTGNESELEEAIQATRTAISITSKGDTLESWHLQNVAVGLAYRYLRSGTLVDLEEAIHIGKRCLESTPTCHSERSDMLNNLGVKLIHRYRRRKSLADIEEAVRLEREAISIAPPKHPDHAMWLSNLAVALGYKAAQTGSLCDLEDAISISRQILASTPADHAHMSGRLANLAQLVRDRFYKTEDLIDLEEAIAIARQSILLTQVSEPRHASMLSFLAGLLCRRHVITFAAEDLEESNRLYLSILNQCNAPVYNRITAGGILIHNNKAPQEAYAAAKRAIELVPQLTPRSLDNSDKQHALSEIVGLASDAAAAALNANEPAAVALGLFEQGYGIISASLEEVKSDALELRDHHPELADRLSSLQKELEGPAPPISALEMGKLSAQGQVRSRREAAKAFDQLIDEIRQRPGFERFFLPPLEEELLSAAERGPIAIVNISEIRCDAILVERHQVRNLWLSVSKKDVERVVDSGELSSSATLEWVWDTIAEPILHALGLTGEPCDGKWPHIWWIPTGPVSHLALHAAGYHLRNRAETVIDRVFSSYNSSVRAIVQGRGRRKEVPNTGQVLLVDMEETPGLDRLSFASKEVAMVEKMFKSTSFRPTRPGRHKQDVTSHLRDCQVFHFAGHGNTDLDDPSNSCLILQEGIDSPLRVADLFEMNLRQQSTFLAYLSACGTGQIKQSKYIDESIHLLSAFHLAGFRHVIGTLWEVKDEICLEMARIVYEEIRDQGLLDEAVYSGIHRASRVLRDRWIGLSQECTGTSTHQDTGLGQVRRPRHITIRDRNTNLGQAHWAPYIHFGL